jgi:hypothetical protein
LRSKAKKSRNVSVKLGSEGAEIVLSAARRKGWCTGDLLRIKRVRAENRCPVREMLG